MVPSGDTPGVVPTAGAVDTETDTVTFSTRTAVASGSGRTTGLFLRSVWHADDKSLDLVLVTGSSPDKNGSGVRGNNPDELATAWVASNVTQPQNARYANWYDRAVGALASLNASAHFGFQFDLKRPNEENEETYDDVPRGPPHQLDVTEFIAGPSTGPVSKTATLRWTWHEPKTNPAGSNHELNKGTLANADAVDSPARLDASPVEKGAQRVGFVQLTRVGVGDTLRVLQTCFGETCARNETLRLSLRDSCFALRVANTAADAAIRERNEFAIRKQGDDLDVATRVSLLLNEKNKKITDLELDLDAARFQVESLERTLRERGGGGERGAGGTDEEDGMDTDQETELENERNAAVKRKASTNAAANGGGKKNTDGGRGRGGGGGKKKAAVETVDMVHDVSNDAKEASTDKNRGAPDMTDALLTQMMAPTPGTQATQHVTHPQGPHGSQGAHATQKGGRKLGKPKQPRPPKPSNNVEASLAFFGDSSGDELF